MNHMSSPKDEIWHHLGARRRETISGKTINQNDESLGQLETYFLTNQQKNIPTILVCVVHTYLLHYSRKLDDENDACLSQRSNNIT